MSTEGIRPGEIDLETGERSPAAEPEAVVEAAAVETPAEDAAVEEPPVDAPAVEEPPVVPAKARGMLEELIEHRTARRDAEKRLQQFESNPAIQRLTPEIQQAIIEGRIVVAPPKTNRDAERERLTGIADRLGIQKADGTPDLEAAAKVAAVIHDEVQAGVRPYVEQTRAVQHTTLMGQAKANRDAAIAFAEANGYDVDTVKETFDATLNMPNGAEMLAQKAIAEELWYSALGRATAKGKTVTPKAVSKAPAAAPIVAEATGRRGATGGIVLSPRMQQIYKENGLDPAATTAKGTRDYSQGVSLED